MDRNSNSLFTMTGIAGLVILAGLALSGTAVAQQAADTVYVNGQIYTVNNAQPWAEAVAIAGGRLIAVGSTKTIQGHADANTKIVDLKGAFVMPGMYDLHTHIDLLLEPKYTNGIQTPPLDPQEMKMAIEKFAKDNPGDGWIFGGTWDPAAFAEAGITAGAKYLDAIMPDRPVALLDTSRHIMIVNSKAMEIGGISKSTYVPDHAVIPKDADGNPIGQLGDGAQSLIAHVLPLADEAIMTEIYAEGQKLLNQYGVIGTRSQHVNTVRLRAVQNLEREDRITARFDMAISWKNDLYLNVPDRAELLSGGRFRYRSTHVNPNYVKLHFDGQPMGRTSYFFDPYQGEKEYRGRLNETPLELVDIVTSMDRIGVGVQIHVLGDRSAKLAIDAIEAARKANGPNGPRHMLAHTAYIRSEDAIRLSRLNVVAEFTYSYLGDIRELALFVAENVVPKSAGGLLHNVKPVVDSGGIAVSGSDLVVGSKPHALEGVSLFASRKPPFESITVEQALKMVTINGAYAMGIEKDAGSIEVGKYADIVVLDGNPLDMPPKKIRDIEVLTTVFEGKVVYERK